MFYDLSIQMYEFSIFQFRFISYFNESQIPGAWMNLPFEIECSATGVCVGQLFAHVRVQPRDVEIEFGVGASRQPPASSRDGFW